MSGRGRLCLLGAGNANDVDLNALAARFGEIHLVDIDPDAVARAVARLPPGGPQMIPTPVDACGIIWGRRAGGRRATARATASGSTSTRWISPKRAASASRSTSLALPAPSRHSRPRPDTGARAAISCVRRARCSVNVASCPVALSFEENCRATAAASGVGFTAAFSLPHWNHARP